jgi:hypothetical protein
MLHTECRRVVEEYIQKSRGDVESSQEVETSGVDTVSMYQSTGQLAVSYLRSPAWFGVQDEAFGYCCSKASSGKTP